MVKILFKDIEQFLDNEDIVLGNKKFIISNIQTSDNINNESLDWINTLKKNKEEYLFNSKAHVIICEKEIDTSKVDLNKKCIIKVDNPKLLFIKIVDKFFTKKNIPEIHKTAIIHPEAEISKTCYIGPNSYIGKCIIGENTVIHGNNFIYDNTKIGNEVIIHAGTVIGSDGFGYQREKNGEFIKFPHLCGVIIGNNVEIGSNTSIDRGTLGNTIIEDGCKIDNLVHIAHNVKICKNTAVIAHTIIGGSVIIGKNTWIAPNSTIRDQITIGENVVIGMGAVVTKNVPDNETWIGSPAKLINRNK